MLRARVFALCAVCAVLVAHPAYSQVPTLGTVYVPDTSFGSFGGFGAGDPGTGISIGGAPIPAFGVIMAAANQFQLMLNVRCSGGDLKDTTSHSDPTQRWLAAERAFRAAKQAQSMIERIGGRGPIAR
jgi:hypothetical protein